MNLTSARSTASRRYLAAAVLGCAVLAVAPAAAAAGSAGRPMPSTADVRTIHLVAHEQHRVFLDLGPHGPSLADESVFAGIVDNASGTTQVGTFGGMLTSLSVTDSVFAATVDLQLKGGQITVQGILNGSASPIVHAVTGGTGTYLGARGEFSFTEPSPGVLDITLTLLTPGR